MSATKSAYFSAPAEKSLKDWSVEPEEGLSSEEAQKRCERHGPNRLREAQRKSAFQILWEQFKSVLPLILAVAAVLSFSFGHIAEGIAIVAVILVNAAIGFVSEYRAIRSMKALQEAGTATARVRRDGKEQEVAIDDVVPGDIVLHEGGDIVVADLRVLEANALKVDESPLTGESVAVYKTTDAVADDAPLAKRSSMLYRGTTVVEGSGMGVVVDTGMDTEIGRIAELAESADEEDTPLEKRLDVLGRRLAVLVLITTAIVAGVGLAAGQPTLLMIQTAIALGVAAIPEGLPIASTLALARGMWHMARRNALVNKLTAVETLGATQVIFTDKTGTLTENNMILRRIVTPQGEMRVDDDGNVTGASPLAERVVDIGVLCSNASLHGRADGEEEATGDPTEVALLRAGLLLDKERDALLERWPEEREVSFDPETMMMATFHRRDGDLLVAVKGAPDAVLEKCAHLAAKDGEAEPFTDEMRREWHNRADAMAADGMRVLAAAEKTVTERDAEPYENLELAGLIGLLDPPRKGVRESVDACQHAGVIVIMVTGDAPATAHAIGMESGLVEHESWSVLTGADLGDINEPTDEQRKHVLDTRVFARVSPEQKLRIMEIYQNAGCTVSMTGDGINDVPALKKADIGVAMGQRGTDAARETAHMVLKDDSFATIVSAVKQGRIIFDNIRRSVMFMLCTNVAEILVVAAASVVGAPLPLRPLHILYLNVLTDVFPALALGVGPGDDRVMDDPPREGTTSILTRKHWLTIGAWSVIVAVCVLGALAIGLRPMQLGEDHAVTMSFMTLGMAKLWFVLNLRDRRSTLFNNNVVRNKWIWGSIVLCLVLLMAAVYLPGLNTILKTAPLSLEAWGVVLLLSVVPVVVGQVYFGVRKLWGKKETR